MRRSRAGDPSVINGSGLERNKEVVPKMPVKKKKRKKERRKTERKEKAVCSFRGGENHISVCRDRGVKERPEWERRGGRSSLSYRASGSVPYRRSDQLLSRIQLIFPVALRRAGLHTHAHARARARKHEAVPRTREPEVTGYAALSCARQRITQCNAAGRYCRQSFYI